ncbi:hypothetical protein V9L05_23895 (plasmid) [Bernardetia sp. Wsw4-3y2]|uniref:hypothetical protein n=1 Tax=Bernardetia sp. Wsw4-3y2 TaxID=3127471 RepID=UPI0030CDDB1F
MPFIQNYILFFSLEKIFPFPNNKNMVGDIIVGLIEGIFKILIKLIFRIFFNSIGAAIRWLFFLGKYSYSHLFGHFTRNITTTILTCIMIVVGGIYLNENSKKEIQEQENTINLSNSNHEQYITVRFRKY